MILGDDSPAITQLAYVTFACVNHGFYGKYHAGLEFLPGTRFSIVQHLWVFMEFFPDSMAAELANYRISVFFSMGLDGVADISECCTGLDLGNSQPHAIVSDVA